MFGDIHATIIGRDDGDLISLHIDVTQNKRKSSSANTAEANDVHVVLKGDVLLIVGHGAHFQYMRRKNDSHLLQARSTEIRITDFEIGRESFLEIRVVRGAFLLLDGLVGLDQLQVSG